MMLKLKSLKSKLGLKLAIISMLCVGLVAGLTVPPAQATGLQLDKKVTKKQTTAASSITAPTFSTTTGNQLFLAFIAVDGPAGTGTQNISSVTGGGLTWTLRKRANAPGSGSSEIWQAVATTAKSNVSVKATMAKTGYVGQLTVATFTGANLSQNGAVAGASATSGAASISLTTTRQNSWVWGVGNDWDRAVARTLGPNQTKVDETVNRTIGDTQWVQRQNNFTPAAGTSVAISTTAPTNDRWNLVAIEIPNAVADTTPPAAPVMTAPVNNAMINNTTPNFAGTGEAGATVSLVIDSNAPIQVPVDGNGNWAYTPTTTIADGSHTVRATQADAAGNVSPASDAINFTIDSMAPTVTVNQKTGQADPTPFNSAAFTIVFSEAINASTFDVSDVAATGTTTGTVTSFSQINPTTWEAVVTGMTRGDTVTLNVGANAAFDAVGNGSQASTSTDNSVTFDDTIVAVPAITSPVHKVRTNNPSVVVAGTGVDGMTIAVQVDGAPISCNEGAVTVTNSTWQCTPSLPLPEGAHTITSTQTNMEGNVSSPSNAVSITIDTARPSVTVNQKDGQADPTTVNAAAYTVVFSEEMNATTLTKEDFTVSGSTGIVTNLTQVNPTTWEATITGMTSGDTALLSLDANKAADLAGNENQASTSTDNSVKYDAPTSMVGWQLNATNTGLAPHGLSCDTLPEYTGPAKVPAGTTISQMKITKSLVLTQGGVTIERSCFKPTVADYTMVQTYDNDLCDNNTGCLPPAGLSVIRDSEFNGSLLDSTPTQTYNRAHTTAFKGIATLQRNYIH
ncbi:MAG TPA: Ig-like domain-containing protein, partial [Candidatus Saccharimonadales bacterium]|nr:Ig-like domain-containing protein [Candidatus Saccharimonadales bacterium]